MRGVKGRRVRYNGQEWRVVGGGAFTYVLERGSRRVFVFREDASFVRGDFRDRAAEEKLRRHSVDTKGTSC